MSAQQQTHTSTRKRRRARVATSLLVALLIAPLAGCATDDPQAACTQGPAFAAARLRADLAVSELSSTTRLELEESVVAITDQVGLLREVSPRALRDPLGVVLAAYGQLLVALDALGWDPLLAASDARVSSARAAFADDTVSSAFADVEAFFDEQCRLALGDTFGNLAVVGTTLPLPPESQEPSLDGSEEDGAPDQELRAIAATLVQRYGVVLSDEEALCLGRLLVASALTASDTDLDDAALQAILIQLFNRCSLDTTPLTNPDN